MSKLEHKLNSAAEERENRMNDIARKVAYKERCKHGMIFEYCGVCQRIETTVDTKFPIDAKDRETGEPKLDANGKQRKIWMPTTTTRVSYMRYR